MIYCPLSPFPDVFTQGNPSDLVGAEPQQVSRHQIPGVKSRQVNHIFGSCNDERSRPESSIRDEIDLVEQCFGRVKNMGSDSRTFFKNLDEEAWGLITAWGHVFSGLSSKRCVVAGIINGTGNTIQIKSTKLVEGGSPCYTIPTKEYDPEQGLLHAGGCILFFGWGNVPNLLNAGGVFMHIETNGFICDLGGQKSRESYAEAMAGCQVGFCKFCTNTPGRPANLLFRLTLCSSCSSVSVQQWRRATMTMAGGQNTGCLFGQPANAQQHNSYHNSFLFFSDQDLQIPILPMTTSNL